jgi:SpoVK/Ycf46/Vps4 family AAA+-type ATPase
MSADQRIASDIRGIIIAAAPITIALCAPVLLTYYLQSSPPSNNSDSGFSKPTEKITSLIGKQPSELAIAIDKLKRPESYLAINPETTIGNIIFYGAPGTGKTQRAKTIAGELGAHFSAITPQDLLQKYYGESSKTVRRWFAEARTFKPAGPSRWKKIKDWTMSWFKNEPVSLDKPTIKKPYCVLFIDEIDGLTVRSELDANHRSGNPLDTLLEEMTSPKNDGILVVGACNQTHLDPALARRFNTKIEVPLPDKEDLKEIFEYYANSYKFNDQEINYDHSYIYRPIDPRIELMHEYKFSGDDVKNTVKKAADVAGRNRRLIMQEDLDHAIQLMRANKQANEDRHARRAERQRAAQEEAPQNMPQAALAAFISAPTNNILNLNVVIPNNNQQSQPNQ